MEPFVQIVEMLRWPLTILAVLALFRGPLGSFIHRLSELRVNTRAGSMEAKTGSQAASSADDARLADAEAPMPPAAIPGPPPVEAFQRISEDDAQRIISYVEGVRQAAQLWHFRFLNYFLVARTQFLLDWLVEGPGGRRAAELVGAQFADAQISGAERDAVLGALTSHDLVRAHPALFEVTQLGRAYHAWAGRTVAMSSNTDSDRVAFMSRHESTVSAPMGAVASVETKVIPADSTTST